MAYPVTSKYCWFNEGNLIVKMFFLNDVPFTFDELNEGYLYDRDIVDEAYKNKTYSNERCLQGIKLLNSEKCHPCLIL